MLSSNVNVAPGANVGNRCLIAMGSVLTSRAYPEKSFIAGVPGTVKSETSGRFYTRKIGRVTTAKFQAN